MSEWIEKRKVKDIVLYEKGKAPANLASEELVPYLSPEYLRGKNQPTFVPNQSNFVWVEDGEIILLWDRSNAGEFFQAKKGVLSSTMTRLIFDRKTNNPDYLFHFFKSIEPQLKAKTSGSGIPHVDKEILGNFKLGNVSPAEQARIARILSTVDAAIAQTEALIAKYGRVRTGLMQDLLTRGIDEHGQIRSEATHEFKESPLGRVPVEWEVVRLEQLLNAAKGRIQTGPFGSQLHSYEYVIEGIPVVMPQDIAETEISTSSIARITEKKANSLRRHRVSVNDVLFSRRGDISRCAVITSKEIGWLSGTGCILMRLESSNVINPFWFKEYYQSAKAQTQVVNNAVGLTMLNLNSGILYNLLIPAIPKKEQDIIVQLLHENQRNIRNHAANVAKLQTLKKALMQDLLSGPVEVEIG